MSTTPYFLLHAVEIQDGVAHVDGRLGELPVYIGHVFNCSFRSHQDWRDRQGAQPCALVINQIESYQQGSVRTWVTLVVQDIGNTWRDCVMG